MLIERNEEYANIILPEYVKLSNAEEFKQELSSLVDEGYNSIVVDCNYLKMISSAGIGSLVLYQNTLKKQNGELKLVNVKNSNIKKIFDMIELHKLIRIQEVNI